jgi:hypothetical protein
MIEDPFSAPPGEATLMSRCLPSNWLPERRQRPRLAPDARLPLAPGRLGPSLAVTIAAAGAAAALAGCGSTLAPGAAGSGSGSGGSTSAGASAAAPGRAGRPGSGTAGSGTAGSGTAGSSASSGASATAGTGSAGTATCTAASLRVRLDTAAAGVAAGSYFVPLEFTNTSGQACQLAGYPAVAFTTGAAGQQIGTAAAADHSVPAHPVLLAPGDTAHAWLQLLSTAAIPASKCHPVTATGLRVAAPGTQSASYVAHPVPACRAVIRGSKILTVHPVQRGKARRGTA